MNCFSCFLLTALLIVSRPAVAGCLGKPLLVMYPERAEAAGRKNVESFARKAHVRGERGGSCLIVETMVVDINGPGLSEALATLLGREPFAVLAANDVTRQQAISAPQPSRETIHGASIEKRAAASPKRGIMLY